MEGRAQTMGEFMPLFRSTPTSGPREEEPRRPDAGSGVEGRREVNSSQRDGSR